MKMYEGWTQDKKWKVYRELREDLEQELLAEESVKDIEPILLADALKQAEEVKKTDVGVKTLFPILDQSLRGLRRGSLYVVGGYTGVGKSLFVQNIVMNAALNSHQILMLTTEMPAHSVASRLRSIWNGYAGDDENFSLLPINLVDNNHSISTEVIEQLLKTNHAREGIEPRYELLVVDNLQWFSRGGANMAESIGLATQKMKQFAVRYDLPIVLVSHLNREVTRAENPDMNHLKGSSYIEQDADAVIMVHRDVDGNKFRKDCLLVSVRKNRLTGDLGYFSLVSDDNLKLMPIADAKIPIR